MFGASSKCNTFTSMHKSPQCDPVASGRTYLERRCRVCVCVCVCASCHLGPRMHPRLCGILRSAALLFFFGIPIRSLPEVLTIN